MATYRVGEAGATVFSACGREVMRLSPGQVVVAGTIDTPGSLAQQHQRLLASKRVRGYADKRVHVAEDKHIGTPD